MFALVDVPLLCEWCFFVTFIFRFICSALFTYLSILFIAYCLHTYYMLFTILFYYIFYTICTLYSLCVSEFEIRIPSIVSILMLGALCHHVIMESWKMSYVNCYAQSKCFVTIIFWLFRRKKGSKSDIHVLTTIQIQNAILAVKCEGIKNWMMRLNTEHWTSVYLFVFCYKIKSNEDFVFRICYALCLMFHALYIIRVYIYCCLVWAHKWYIVML